jgi:curli biogenesis system outer membrane secretion channel CsgG
MRGEDSAEGPPSIAVLRFENPLANDWWSVDGIRRAQELLTAEIQAAGAYAVMDRVTLDTRMQVEKLLQPPGQLSPAGAVKLGRTLGLSYLVTGSLSAYGAGGKVGKRRLLGLWSGRDFAAEISLRVFDGATGRLVWADDGRGTAAFDPAWVDADPGSVDAAMFDRLLAPLLRDLATRMLSAGLESVEPSASSLPAQDPSADEDGSGGC